MTFSTCGHYSTRTPPPQPSFPWTGEAENAGVVRGRTGKRLERAYGDKTRRRVMTDTVAEAKTRRVFKPARAHTHTHMSPPSLSPHTHTRLPLSSLHTLNARFFIFRTPAHRTKKMVWHFYTLLKEGVTKNIVHLGRNRSRHVCRSNVCADRIMQDVVDARNRRMLSYSTVYFRPHTYTLLPG